MSHYPTGPMETPAIPAPDASDVPPFEWRYEGRIVVLDNGARLPRMAPFERLMALNAFAVIVLDPASVLHDNAHLKELPEFQIFGHATLGDGRAAMLYACVDPLASATLKPVMPVDLPEGDRVRRQVIAELPVSTLQLDAIEGLDRIDWLLLDDRNAVLPILEHAVARLEHTSLIDIRIPLQGEYAGQVEFLQVIPWLEAHGFTFHGFAGSGLRSLLPPDGFFAKQKASRWDWADAVFIPGAARLAVMDPTRLTKLACVADLAYGFHDLAAELLGRLDPAAATHYLDARGYVSPYYKEPDVFTLTAENAPAPWPELHVEDPLPLSAAEPVAP